ncbi:biotin transporter BioY [Leucobacter allii]|uniref:biotin transporter BioY n=1 Tax=Leucobacter allii TaxID=2932247 RepID=UPI0021132AE6|nr:biotin transporter BioY [Leucobacter allii]
MSSTDASTAAAPDAPQAHAPRRRSVATDLALVATFAALIAVCSIIPGISLGPAAVTLQTLAILLTGAVLGATRGLLAVLLYIAVGAAGLPIFSGGAAGLAPSPAPRWAIS